MKKWMHRWERGIRCREPVFWGKSTQIKAKGEEICHNRTVSLFHYLSCYHQGRPNKNWWHQSTHRLLQTVRHITPRLYAHWLPTTAWVCSRASPHAPPVFACWYTLIDLLDTNVPVHLLRSGGPPYEIKTCDHLKDRLRQQYKNYKR